jgi:hypothetical protein
MKTILSAIIAISLAFSFTTADAQEFGVPKKPNKRALFAENAKVNGRDPAGYLGINSTIVFPLDGENYGVLYGVLAGKRKGDAFHFFKNPDLGFYCKGTGVPTANGGRITNECFLNGASTGQLTVAVPDYGKVAGKMIFDVFDSGDYVGKAAMQWGLTYPNYKSVYKFLKANGG